MKQATAHLNYLRIAPRKVRLVASLIQGLPAQEAEAQLLAQRRRPAPVLLKLLRSALANAKQQQLIADKLVVSSIRVDQGPMLKRGLPRALGRVTPIQKKSSHISIILTEGDKSFPMRYALVVPKKEKKEKKKGRVKSTGAVKPPVGKEKATEKPGFFKKVFQRKSV